MTHVDGLTIRDAIPGDAPTIASIYGHHVLYGVATYETEPPSQHEMRARVERVVKARWPWLVAEHDGSVVGYAYATQLNERPAYLHTAEDSVYIKAEHARRGMGRALLTELIARTEASGFRQLIAVIGGAEPGSIALHEALGFRHVGRIEAAGWKHGRWLDNVYMQRALGDGAGSEP